MVFKNPYWTTATKIQLLQGWIIVHSILYYEFDMNIVDDNVYDMNEVQLAKMMSEFPKEARKSRYAYAFRGFDGSTGFDIPKKLTVNDRNRFYEMAAYLSQRHEK